MKSPISNIENFEELKAQLEASVSLTFCEELNKENVIGFLQNIETLFENEEITGKYLRRTRNPIMDLFQNVAYYQNPKTDRNPYFKVTIQENAIYIYHKCESYSASYLEKVREVMDNIPNTGSLRLRECYKKVMKIQSDFPEYPILNFALSMFDISRKIFPNTISYQITPNENANPTFELLFQIERR
ncbi:MAG: hypothetical protein ACI81T_003582 [Bacteroidia bacterium]|jgi:hypothetical protein